MQGKANTFLVKAKILSLRKKTFLGFTSFPLEILMTALTSCSKLATSTGRPMDSFVDHITWFENFFTFSDLHF
jgi:hypothetical protein